ncbi:MAG: hypothetical protein FRX48_05712 [Lasallia pustulata]|uniref:RPEL repeat n=1 Tax=Lasallia pustulata TaxID=136370 RepID=A0A5M8PLD7_9LECA|nr:MAG: hypothetical protein FRX48_05712 [Lasallia pustulata]
MADQSQAPKVDSTPISPLERRDSLEKHLQHRPDPQDLKNRNILLDTNAAPALQSAALELERQRTTDSLKKGLERRPERDELIERTSPLSLPLSPIQFLLFRASAFLPQSTKLTAPVPPGNILPDSTAAPAIQGQQRELLKHMRADSLEQKISNRPKPEDLVREGILKEDEDTTKE